MALPVSHRALQRLLAATSVAAVIFPAKRSLTMSSPLLARLPPSTLSLSDKLLSSRNSFNADQIRHQHDSRSSNLPSSLTVVKFVPQQVFIHLRHMFDRCRYWIEAYQGYTPSLGSVGGRENGKVSHDIRTWLEPNDSRYRSSQIHPKPQRTCHRHSPTECHHRRQRYSANWRYFSSLAFWSSSTCKARTLSWLEKYLPLRCSLS